ncbi:DUF6346 domain-containing protein [Micromonospora okii]|uniref:DUF6346 domain-containing protein n=1 Tax=Micromonospora okii TaxID=1182970 RepID=UPI001E35C898|nr:DUF6346 domain-containing protein [Micromonospora okii]
MATALALVAGIVLSTVVFDTVASFYPGTGAVKSTPPEQPAEALVGDCQRVGPVSGDGLGYWWHCGVTVRTRDGREVETVVEHSVVTPRDRGKAVEFREVCYGKDNSDCRYGRPVARVWALALSMMGIVRIGLLLLLAVGVSFALVRAVVGVPAVIAWYNRRNKR